MINFDEEDRVVEALGGERKCARLAAIKQRYDPAGLFGHVNGRPWLAQPGLVRA
jgi:FAD/FMN-containing dehydrogenase